MRVRKLTEREAAQAGPLDMKGIGSVEWCYQVAELLKNVWQNRNTTEDRFNAVLEMIKEHQVWKKIPTDGPYGSLDNLLDKEIGVNEKQALGLIQKRAKPEEWAKARPGLGKWRPPTLVERANKGDTITFKRGSTGAAYLVARIARDRPDILARMEAGEFQSVHAAAVEAGFAQARVIVPLDTERAAALLVKHFGPEGAAELAAAIERLTREKAAA